MEFRILGSLEVVHNDRGLAVSGSKRRALLAVLCLHPNEVVTSDRLVDALWGERPPQKAQSALQFHIAQLRKVLGPGRIETRTPGYVLRLSHDELDAARFERLLAPGNGDRAPNLREALSLWRGPALADFQYEPFAQSEIARLEELRVAALEERVDDDLASGRHAEVVGELEALVRDHPLRERLRAQLMLALYRCGRQAEALALYQQTRKLLVEELGIDPGLELQRLERQILNQDTELAAPAELDRAPTPTEPAAPREERKVVTALFCDLVGFTSRAEELDPEDVSALLSRYHLRLRAELERFGGTVEKFAGDAVLALFGAPIAHEDDAERALRAALAIRDWIAELEDDLEVRIGVATGEAFVRLGASPAEGEAMAVGDVVNTAARFQQVASQGAILVGEATYRATRSSVVYERIEAVAVKGKAELVPVWLAKSVRSAGDADTERPTTPLIGRSHELALLEQTYARTVHESSAQLLTIVGEPGIGKTRLLSEFRALLDAQADEVVVRHGRCLAYGDGITFWALGQIVKQHAGILESDTPEVAAEKLAAAVDAVARDSERQWLFARLAPLVGAAHNEATVEQEEAFAGWRTFLEAVAAQQPLVLLVEDLHWADAPLLGFLDRLVDWVSGVPLLVVATARPELFEGSPDWGGGKRNASTIALAPLSDADTSELVAELLAQATLPAETQQLLLERAGGNPLYAEEFVRMLGDRGLLVRRDGFVEIATDAEIPVPDNVQAVIAARLDTLAPERKELVHDASVIGKVFWAGAVAAISHVPKEAVLAGLHELVRKELVRRVRRSSIADDVEYTFWHVLVRDVAYGQIPRLARARKHVAAAEWIERIAGERVTDHAEFLADHYATAIELFRASGKAEEVESLEERAVQSLVLAGDRAIRLDQGRGERYFQRALALLPDGDQEWRPKVLARAADAATKSAEADFDQIERDLGEAIAALLAQGEVVAAADAMRQLSFAMSTHGESGEARVALVEEARRLLERGPPGVELALVYERVVHEHLMSGRYEEVIEWAKKALPLLERFGLEDEALRTRSRVANARCSLGDLDAVEAAREIAREAVDLERGYGTFAAVNALGNLGTVEHWFGAGPAAALEPTRAGVELARRRGLERPGRWYMAGLAEHLYDLGEWDEALRVNDSVAAWESERGRSMIGTVAPPYAVRILAARGELDAATSLVEELLPRAREVQDVQMVLPALTAAALLEVARGDRSSALALADEVLELTRERDDVFRLAYIGDVVRVCAAFADVSRVERLIEASPPIGVRCANLVLSGGAILAEATGGHDRAERLYAEAAMRWVEYGSVVEQAYALLGLARCRLATGRSAEAEQPAREARTLFAKLAARPLLAEAEELLGRATTLGDPGVPRPDRRLPY